MAATLRAFALGLVCAAAGIAPASAQTTSQSFTIGAVVVPGCRVQSLASGDWGRIDLGTVPGVATGTIEADLLSAGNGIAFECTPGTTASVRVDGGLHASGGNRTLAPATGTARLAYRLILDSGAEWTTQAVALDFTQAQPVRRLPLRGRTTLPGALAAGRYTDTVRVTVSW